MTINTSKGSRIFKLHAEPAFPLLAHPLCRVALHKATSKNARYSPNASLAHESDELLRFRSGAPIPGDQAPVRLCDDSLSWLGQEHGATERAVCAVESVDGVGSYKRYGRGAPVACKNEGKALVLTRSRRSSLRSGKLDRGFPNDHFIETMTKSRVDKRPTDAQ